MPLLQEGMASENTGESMSKIQIPTHGWKPRDYQLPLWNYLEGGGKRAAVCWARRHGKDEVMLQYMLTAMLKRIGTYWYMLPLFSMCRKAIWDAINPRTGLRRINDIFPEELIVRKRDTDMFIELSNGSTFQLTGSDSYNSLIGSPPVGVVYSEYSTADPFADLYISPILEENGGFSLFNSTSRGDNHFRTLIEYAIKEDDWFGQIIPATETGVFSAEQLGKIEGEMCAKYGDDMGRAMFRQEYLCSFQGATLGSYYGKQMDAAENEGRITKVPHQPGQEVDTFWDLGVDDSMSIWFMQTIGKSYHFIDYYENSGYGLEHYAKVLRAKDYLYGNHYMPHDAKQREMTNSEIAKSRKEVGEDLGIKPIFSIKRPKSMEKIIHIQIPAVRNVLPQCWFDKKRCSMGISALKAFRAEYNQEKKILGSRYLHNWACLSGDTKIRTLNGWFCIKDLVDKDFYVWGYSTEQHRLIPAKAKRCWLAKKSTNNTKVVLDSGNSITCTSDHRFMTREEKWVCAEDLKAGMSLMPFYERLDKSRGYTKVHLTDGSIADEHKFVYQQFNGFIKDGMVIHHKDSDPRNNNPGNLEQLTKGEHCGLHAREPGRIAKLQQNAYRGGNKGKKNPTLIAYHGDRRKQGVLLSHQKPGHYTPELKEK